MKELVLYRFPSNGSATADLLYNIVQILPFENRVVFIDNAINIILNGNRIVAEYLGDDEANRVNIPISPLPVDYVVAYIGDDTFCRLNIKSDTHKPPSYSFSVFKPTTLASKNKLLIADLVKHYYPEVLVKVIHSSNSPVYSEFKVPYGFQHFPAISIDIPIVKVIDEDGDIHIVEESDLEELRFNIRCLCMSKTCKDFLKHIGKPNKKGLLVIIEKISAVVDADYEHLSHTQVNDVTIIYVN